MNPVSLSISHLVPRRVLSGALAVLCLCVAMLLASGASGAPTADAPSSDGPLLAPFRWTPLGHDLA